MKENHTAGIPRDTEDRRPSSAAEEEGAARLPSTDERLDTDDERPVRLSISTTVHAPQNRTSRPMRRVPAAGEILCCDITQKFARVLPLAVALN